MTETSAPAKPSLTDRLFLYGIRSIVIVAVIVVGGSVLVVHGWLVDHLDYIAAGSIIIIIGVVIGVAVIRTEYTMITKKYFAAEAMVGKTGRAHAAIPAGTKGDVMIEHETWSSIAEEDIASEDGVVVTAVESDKVTLRVKRHTP